MNDMTMRVGKVVMKHNGYVSTEKKEKYIKTSQGQHKGVH